MKLLRISLLLVFFLTLLQQAGLAQQCVVPPVGRSITIRLDQGPGESGPAIVRIKAISGQKFEVRMGKKRSIFTLKVLSEFLLQTCLNTKVTILSRNAGVAARAQVSSADFDTADLNGDGVLDLVQLDLQDNLLVALSNIDGSLRTPVKYPIPAGGESLVLADLNADGKMDIVVTADASSTPLTASVNVLLGKGDGTFQPAVEYLTGADTPQSLIVDDFTGDGKPDIAVANLRFPLSSEGDVAVLVGRGDGTFLPASANTIPGAATSLVAGDFNGDGKLDVAVSGGSAGVAILLGSGNGTLSSPVYTSVPYRPTFLGAADMNGDGKLDLVAQDKNAGILTVLLGNGAGGFAASPKSYLTNHDVNGFDFFTGRGGGLVDVVLPGLTSNELSIYYGLGDGSLEGPPAYPLASSAKSIATADFDGDGLPDVAVADNELSILLGQTGGTLGSPTVIHFPLTDTSPQSSSVVTADFNNDDRPDIAVADQNNDRLIIYLGKGDGTFDNGTAMAVGGCPGVISTADFNGDGKADIVVPNRRKCISAGGGSLSVLLGNGNGTFQPPANYEAGLRPFRSIAADVNGDGHPDVILADGEDSGSSISSLIRVMLGSATGALQPWTAYPTVRIGLDSVGLDVADVDRDGKLDIITTGESSTGAVVGILAGIGNGTFQALRTVPLSTFATGVLARDLDNDGKVDLVVSRCCGDLNAAILPGRGSFYFYGEIPIVAGQDPGIIRAVDMNKDGQLDLLVAAGSAGTGIAGVLLNNLDPAPTNYIVSAATGIAPVAPESIASAFQAGAAATGTVTPSENWPISLGGYSVNVRDGSGTTRAARLHYTSPQQINFLVPTGTEPGTATVTIQPPSGPPVDISVPVVPVAPGLFVANSSGVAAAYGLRVRNSQQTQEPLVQLDSTNSVVPLPLDLGPSTDQVFLLLYGTGIRGAGNNVQVDIGGQTATVTYAGPQGFYPGLDQVNVIVPRALIGKGNVRISLTAAGVAAKPAFVTIR